MNDLLIVVCPAVIVFVNSMIIFFFLRDRKFGTLDRTVFVLLVGYCIGALALPNPAETKVLITALTLMSCGFRLMAERRRKATGRQHRTPAN